MAVLFNPVLGDSQTVHILASREEAKMWTGLRNTALWYVFMCTFMRGQQATVTHEPRPALALSQEGRPLGHLGGFLSA